jgi:hypothetical protein
MRLYTCFSGVRIFFNFRYSDLNFSIVKSACDKLLEEMLQIQPEGGCYKDCRLLLLLLRILHIQYVLSRSDHLCPKGSPGHSFSPSYWSRRPVPGAPRPPLIGPLGRRRRSLLSLTGHQLTLTKQNVVDKF